MTEKGGRPFEFKDSSKRRKNHPRLWMEVEKKKKSDLTGKNEMI